jgi:phospholipase D1/2
MNVKLLVPPADLTEEQISERGLEGTCSIQLLRSASPWSIGTPTESSIYNAYLHYIRNAQHYIYIENQFFISSVAEAGGPVSVRNEIAKAICDRIIRAHLNNQTFRVYIVLPLLPAFESEVSQTAAATVRIIVHWHQMGIAKGESSIFSYLAEAGVRAADYISFCSLRTHGHLGIGPEDTFMDQPGPLVTEQVYVHSKMMLVDDRVALIGSANINDRSLLGSRDSEVAAIIEDTELVPSQMNGQPYMASRFALSLRLRLFSEHLGIDDTEQLMDPIASEFFTGTWNQTASTNTAIYRELFRVIPDDTVSDWEDYRRFVNTPFQPVPGHLATRAPPELIQASLDKIQGNLVQYPLFFIHRENLSIMFPAKEFLAPMDIFV